MSRACDRKPSTLIKSVSVQLCIQELAARGIVNKPEDDCDADDCDDTRLHGIWVHPAVAVSIAQQFSTSLVVDVISWITAFTVYKPTISHVAAQQAPAPAVEGATAHSLVNARNTASRLSMYTMKKDMFEDLSRRGMTTAEIRAAYAEYVRQTLAAANNGTANNSNNW